MTILNAEFRAQTEMGVGKSAGRKYLMPRYSKQRFSSVLGTILAPADFAWSGKEYCPGMPSSSLCETFDSWKIVRWKIGNTWTDW
jgi:hypothetical protein